MRHNHTLPSCVEPFRTREAAHDCENLQQLMAQTRLVLSDLPYSPITVDVEMVWHQRANRDKGIQWLKQELISCAVDFT